MGFLDNLLPAKKKNQKVVKPPEAVERGKKPQTNVTRVRGPSTPSSDRTDSSVATSSFFGTLRRLKGPATSSAAKVVDRNKGTKTLGNVDNNANFTTEPPTTRSSKYPNNNVTIRKNLFGLPPRSNVPKVKSLHNLVQTQPKSYQQPKPKRPVTVALPDNVTVRRGHKEGQTHPDNISRTSSITNLDSLEANLPPKGAKPRKANSKEKIDKQAQDGKKVTKNNNKLEPTLPPPLSYSTDSLQETELHQLRKQLKEMADEKSSLALQLGEQRGQLTVLQNEILKLKTFQEESNMEMEKLAEENTVLRNRLRDVAHSPLSDNEKQQLLFENRHHSSAPASIATNVVDENGGDVTTCTTPDWDKHSSGNISEVSVACLQDKINQMQETHYSTNEELQATLQELTDLQRQLTELQQENERLNEEKTLMFDSLCRQTERLNDSRQEADNLKQLLYRERTDESGVNQFETAVEREQKLVDLLRSAQEEREQFLIKLEQVQAELQDARSGNADKTETINQLSERVKTLECTLDAKHAEHKQLDQELAQAKDQCSGKQIEIDRLRDLLENARTKINELEQDRTLSDKSELDELLDNARKEKDQLESEMSYLKEQLARSKNEIEKLKEQILVLQEECKVTRNNAKSTQSDLEYKCEKIASEKAALSEQLQQFQEAVNEFQVQAQCHLEDKRQLSAVLSETQRNLSEAERKNLNLENEMQELKKLRAEENDEWEKFQNDLLTSVRVANDFKTEAQQELQKIILENKTYRERVRLLEGQLDKLKGDIETANTSTQTDIILTSQIVSIARNLDPTLVDRLSYLEHSSSLDESETSRNMEKLFPMLRRSKSKESLDVSPEGSSKHKRHKSESGLKKSQSKNDLTKDEPETGLLKLSLKKSKSREDLASAEGDKKPPKEKGSRGFMKWNKSKEPVEQLDPPPSKEKKVLLKRNKSRDNLVTEFEDQPRKSIDSSSDSNKSEPKPELLSKLKMKKRERKSEARIKQQTHPKFMSVEEETLLKSLDVWYGNIDQSLPDEFLTDEDRAIKKLKILYEDDSLKEKPVAHKPKEYLAISKPLLDSVVLNPKLERIFKDPNLPTVDSEVRQSALEESHSDADGPPLTNLPKKTLEQIEEYPPKPSYRAVSYNRMSSDVLPTDSASNPRYSVKYFDLPKPNVYINYENLDEIVHEIPPDAAENRLSEGQKFALKLKQALNEAEKKHTLKKTKKKSIRGQEISAPLRESVEKNWKLKEILLNPQIKIAEEPHEKYEWKRHSTDISSHLNTLERPSVVLQQNSKSYEDISFSFVPETNLLKKYDSVGKTTTDSSSSRSFTSAEFNLDTGDVVLRSDNQKEDLLYNATINKTKSEKRQSKELIEKMINELAKQEEEDDEEIHHPKIIEARQQYKMELQLALKRLDQDELRRSARKQRLKVLEQSNESISKNEVIVEDANGTSFGSYSVSKSCESAKIGEFQNEQVLVNRPPVPKHRTKLPDALLNAECVNYRVVEDVPQGEQFNNQDSEVVSPEVHEEGLEVHYVNLCDAHIENATSKSSEDLIANYDMAQRADRSGDFVNRIEAAEFTEQHEKYGVFHVVQAPSREEFIGFAALKDASSFHNLTIKEFRPKAEALNGRNPDCRRYEESDRLPRNQSFHDSAEIRHTEDPPKIESPEELDDQNLDYKSEEIHAEFDPYHMVHAVPSEKEQFTVPKDETLHGLVIERQYETDRAIYGNLVYRNSDPRFGEYHVKPDLENMIQASIKEEFTASALPKDESMSSLVIEETQSKVEPSSPEKLDGQIQHRKSDAHHAKYDIHNAVQAPLKEEFVEPTESILHSLVIKGQHEVDRSSSEVPEDMGDQNPDLISNEDHVDPDLHHVVQAPVKEDFTAFAVPKNVSMYSLVIEEFQIEPEGPRNKVSDEDQFQVLINPEDLHKVYQVATEYAMPDTKEYHSSVIEEAAVDSPENLDNTIQKEPNSMHDLVIDEILPKSEDHYLQHHRNSLEPKEYSDFRPELSETSNMDGNFILPPADFLDDAHNDLQLSKSHYDTLKENQYGVVSPAGVRYTYRNVVKEFKSRYSEDDDAHPEQTEDNDFKFENPDDFVDHFFKPVLHEPLAMSRIDEEMQDVIDKYLNDRGSLLDKSGLKQFDNFENSTKIPKLDVTEGWQSATSVTVIEKQTATLSPDEETEPLSIEDFHFIEEMKRKYAEADTASNNSEDDDNNYKTSRPLSEIDKHNLLITKPSKEPPQAKCKIPRPLSGINEQDLLLIEKVTKNIDKIEKPHKVPSRIPIKKQNSEEHLPPSLRPKRPANLPLNRPKSYATSTSSSLQFNKRFSYQEGQEHTPVEGQRSSGRLSDLIFKETIFIPHTPKTSKQSPADKKPKSSDTETIFIDKTTQESPLTPEQTISKSPIKINWNRYPTSPSNTWSNSLKKGLLDTPVIAYEPVYSRTSKEDLQTKPLPVPRVNAYQPLKTSVLTTEMTDTNFSDQKKLNDVKVEPGNHAQSQEVILVEQSKAHTNLKEHVETKISNPTAKLPSEELESDVEEIPRQSSSNLDTSNVNLFHMNTPPAYDSYLELFKSRESKEFDTLTHKPTPPHLGGFVYVEEVILEDAGASSTDDSLSTPKIVDFVPLDEKTTPVFTKPESARTYDTLEREKTFHVLGQAASIASNKEETSVELLAKKSSNLSQSSSSRASFSQAKKLFEALAEANKEDKSRLSSGKLPKGSKDFKSMDQESDGAEFKE